MGFANFVGFAFDFDAKSIGRRWGRIALADQCSFRIGLLGLCYFDSVGASLSCCLLHSLRIGTHLLSGSRLGSSRSWNLGP